MVIHITGRDARWVGLAYVVSTFSKDQSTKVGAVVVGRDPRLVAFGYNGFPPGIADDHRLDHRHLKYRLIQHAERNALDNAQFDLCGATLYVTMMPCSECAKSIVTKGICRVVCPPPDTHLRGDRKDWAEDANWTSSIFSEAGTQLDYYDPNQIDQAIGPIAKMLDQFRAGGELGLEVETL